MTTTELATALGISTRRVTRYAAAGILPSLKTDGRYSFPADAITIAHALNLTKRPLRGGTTADPTKPYGAWRQRYSRDPKYRATQPQEG